MRYSVIVSALFAATALAAPVIQVVEVQAVVTETVTAGTPKASEAAAAAAAAAAAKKQKDADNFLEAHPKTTPPPPPPAPVHTPAPAPVFLEKTTPQAAAATPAAAPVKAASSGSDGSPMSGDATILSIANKWRSLYNLPTYTWDESLVANSQQVGENGGGVNEIHSLIPNTNEGQVITPGQSTATNPSEMQGDTPFELAWVSWLCEVPGDAQLQSSFSGNGVAQCSIVKSILNMEYSDTGHHDILVNPSYTKLGCAFTANPAANSGSTYQGLWVCGCS